MWWWSWQYAGMREHFGNKWILCLRKIVFKEKNIFSLVIVGLAVSIIIFILSQVNITFGMNICCQDSSWSSVLLRRCRCTRTTWPKCASSSLSSAATSSPCSLSTRDHSPTRSTRITVNSSSSQTVSKSQMVLRSLPNLFPACWPLPGSSSSISAPSPSFSSRHWSVLSRFHFVIGSCPCSHSFQTCHPV